MHIHGYRHEWNLEELLETIWDYTKMIRIYTKVPYNVPYVQLVLYVLGVYLTLCCGCFITVKRSLNIHRDSLLCQHLPIYHTPHTKTPRTYATTVLYHHSPRARSPTTPLPWCCTTRHPASRTSVTSCTNSSSRSSSTPGCGAPPCATSHRRLD